jgi:hypothetical protein
MFSLTAPALRARRPDLRSGRQLHFALHLGRPGAG